MVLWRRGNASSHRTAEGEAQSVLSQQKRPLRKSLLKRSSRARISPKVPFWQGNEASRLSHNCIPKKRRHSDLIFIHNHADAP